MKNLRKKQKKEKVSNSHKSKKRFILPIFLILIIIGSLGYIGYGKHQNKVEDKELEFFNIGAQYGAEALLLKVFNEAITCSPLPINNGSMEISLIAVECLNIPEQ